MSYSVIPTVIAGPAILTRAAQVWYSESDIKVGIEQSTWEPMTARFGGIGLRPTSFPVVTVSFKPDGQVVAAKMAASFPYTGADVGKSIFTTADVPLVINSINGKQYTFTRSGICGVPSLNLAADKPAIDGTLQFRCLAGIGLDPTATNSYLKIETVSYPGDTGFSETSILATSYTAAYGSGTGLTAMESLDGFRLECPIRTQQIRTDRHGVVDERLVSVGPATCKFTPVGMTDTIWSSIANADGAALSVPGSAASATDLVISGTGLTVTMAKAWVAGSGLGFGVNDPNFGELVFHSRTVFTTGTPAKPLTIAVA
jgi:hypothetical protein